jgi:purine nucleosidase
MPKKVIVDCDPGHDDAIALLLAHGSPEIELLAVTTVMGNQTLPKVTHNARVVATIAGMTGVPIAAGCPRPLVRELETASSIHGDSGLDGPVLPEPTAPLDPRHAVDLLIETIMTEEPGTVTLVPTAALTNIAMAARREPRIVERVREVVLMGGAISGGNRSAAAEFNIITDPEAAHIVVHESWPVTMIGLVVTHQALATPDVRERIAAIGTGPSRFVGEVLGFFAATYLAEQGFAHPPVHDPCAVARVIDPAVVTVRPAPLDIELSGRLTTGMTVADLRGPAPAGCTTQVGIGLDRDRFWALVVDALERIGEVSAAPPSPAGSARPR